jgi:hypothetical protein
MAPQLSGLDFSLCVHVVESSLSQNKLILFVHLLMALITSDGKVMITEKPNAMLY